MLAHAGGVDEFLATVLAATGLVVGWIGLARIRGRGFGRLPRAAGVAFLVVAPIALVGSVLVPSWFGPGTGGPRPASTATVAFVEPAAGDVVRGDTLTVDVDLEGGRIVTETTTDLRPDEGHLHLYLDGELLSMTYGPLQTVAIDGLLPGAHELRAEFVAADHAPFAPRVTSTVTFVKDDA